MHSQTCEIHKSWVEGRGRGEDPNYSYCCISIHLLSNRTSKIQDKQTTNKSGQSPITWLLLPGPSLFPAIAVHRWLPPGVKICHFVVLPSTWFQLPQTLNFPNTIRSNKCRNHNEPRALLLHRRCPRCVLPYLAPVDTLQLWILAEAGPLRRPSLQIAKPSEWTPKMDDDGTTWSHSCVAWIGNSLMCIGHLQVVGH